MPYPPLEIDLQEYQDVKSEIGLFWSSFDPLESSKDSLIAVCDALYWRHNHNAPARWGYNYCLPSDSALYDILCGYSAQTLTAIGHVLHRHIHRCLVAGYE